MEGAVKLGELIVRLEEQDMYVALIPVIVATPDGKVYDVESIEPIMDGQAFAFVRINTKERP